MKKVPDPDPLFLIPDFLNVFLGYLSINLRWIWITIVYFLDGALIPLGTWNTWPTTTIETPG